MGASLSTMSLYDYPLGSEAKKSDGSAGAASDTLRLQTRAVAIFITGAGTLTVRPPASCQPPEGPYAGPTRAFADGELAKNMWHPMEIGQVLATGTSLAATGYRLGYARY